MKDLKMVVADDGSTSVKLSWFESETLKTKTVSNSAVYGLGFGESSEHTFTIAGESEKITFSDSASSIRSTTEHYQYDAHSVAAIHNALIKCGFEGEKLLVVVTLPLSQFYKNRRKNEANIQRKKENILRKVSPEIGKGNEIVEVRVFPEGIPAVYPKLINSDGKPNVDEDELTFLADMGGTTLDLCLFSGAAAEIMAAKSYDIGMFNAFNAVRNEAGNDNLRDNNIKKLLETGKAAGGKLTIDRVAATSLLMTNAKNAIIDFLGGQIGLLSNCFCIGGGAELLSEKLKEVEVLNPEVIENPVEALSISIANISNK